MSGGLQRGANQKYQDPFEVDRYVDYFLKLRQPLHTKRVLEFLGKGHFMLGMSRVETMISAKLMVKKLHITFKETRIVQSTRLIKLFCINFDGVTKHFWSFQRFYGIKG